MPLRPDRDKLRSHLTKDRRVRRSRYEPLTADERAISAAIATGVQRARDRIRSQRLREALIRNNLVDVQASIDTDALNTVYEPITDIFTKVTLKEVERTLKTTGVGYTLSSYRFDIINPNVVRYAQQQAAALVTRLTTEQRKAVNQAIVDAVMGKFTVDETARIIRSSIGLTDRYTQAVATRYEGVRDLALADKLSPSVAARMATNAAIKYADKLVRARGRAIARTEIMAANNAGKQIGWQTAVDRGVLSPTSRKRWVLAADACEVCRRIADEFNLTEDMPMVNMPFYDEEADWSGLQPPVHPNCRCTTSLITPAKALIDELLMETVA